MHVRISKRALKPSLSTSLFVTIVHPCTGVCFASLLRWLGVVVALGPIGQHELHSGLIFCSVPYTCEDFKQFLKPSLSIVLVVKWCQSCSGPCFSLLLRWLGVIWVPIAHRAYNMYLL